MKLKAHRVKKAKLSLNKYFILSLVISIIGNILVLFHAGASAVNLFIYILIIIGYKKYVVTEKTRKVVSFAFYFVITATNILSFLFFILIVIAVCSAFSNNLDFTELLSSL